MDDFDYRAVHRQKYIERERERERAREAERELERMRGVFRTEFDENILPQFKTCIEDLRSCESISVVKDLVGACYEMLSAWELHADESIRQHYHSKKDALSELGLELLQTLNSNRGIITNFHNQQQVFTSRQVEEIVKNILKSCYLDTEGLDVCYEMDCSNDEQLAQLLAQQLSRERERFGNMYTDADGIDPTPINIDAEGGTGRRGRGGRGRRPRRT